MAEAHWPDEMLAGLRDIRLPDAASGGTWAELAAASGLGLLIACGLSLLIPLISRKADISPGPEDALALIRKLPEAEQSVALLHLIRRYDPATAADLSARLYQREGAPDRQELEQLAAQLGARAHG